MAYDEKIAERLRELLADEDGLSEKRMFGGLAFLIDGKLAIAASSRGGILARTDPDHSQRLLANPHVASMEMRGRPMAGWLTVDPEAVTAKRDLRRWVERCVAYARSLPEKS